MRSALPPLDNVKRRCVPPAPSSVRLSPLSVGVQRSIQRPAPVDCSQTQVLAAVGARVRELHEMNAGIQRRGRLDQLLDREPRARTHYGQPSSIGLAEYRLALGHRLLGEAQVDSLRVGLERDRRYW